MRTMLALAMGALIAITAAASGHAGGARKPRVARVESGAVDVEPLRRQAERGIASAQTRLGFLYATGRGVPQSREEAFYWYSQAAAQGDAAGQFLLGLAYDKGHGVEPDAVLAYMWLDLATARADRRAHNYYAKIRDAVASKLTLAQLERGQYLAVRWRRTAW
jgi:TPR repeat protein